MSDDDAKRPRRRPIGVPYAAARRLARDLLQSRNLDPAKDAWHQADAIIEVAGRSNAREIDLSHLAHLEVLPGRIASLQRLESLRARCPNLRDISAISNLKLRELDVTGSALADLGAIAKLTTLIDGLKFPDPYRGLRYSATPAARHGALSRLSLLDQPAQTVETINHLRRKKGLREYYPEWYHRPVELWPQPTRSPDSIARLVPPHQEPFGANFQPSDDFFSISASGGDFDQEIAHTPLANQLHKILIPKARSFLPIAQRLSNQPGWASLGETTRRFTEIIDRDIGAVAAHIGEVWATAVDLGSFLDLDRRLQLDSASSNAIPLDAEIRRQLEDLVRAAAPWVRLFPTARMLDDQGGAFLSRSELLEPASQVVKYSGQSGLFSQADRELLEALVEAAGRGELQAAKASWWTLASARNLAVAAASLVASFYLMGATSSYVAEHSLLVKKAGDAILRAEDSVIKLFENYPADIKASMRALIDRLREDREPDRRQSRRIAVLPTRRSDD